jgi:hypothetical protein
MKTTFFDVTKAGRRLALAILTQSLTLCILACFTGVPALGDSESFQLLMTGTVTTPNVPNVSYSNTGAPSTTSYITVSGDAELTYTSISPLVSWNNGVLSFTVGPISGLAGTNSLSEFGDSYFAPLQINNENDYGVEVPLLLSTSYAIDLNCPSCDGNIYDTSAWGGLTVRTGAFTTLDVLFMQCANPDPTIGPGGCWSTYSPHTPTAFPINAELSETADVWVPANTDDTFTILCFDGAYGGALPTPTPEPGTLTLIGTGLLGLLGLGRRRFHMHGKS